MKLSESDLLRAGVCRGVYSLLYPEVRETLSSLLEEFPHHLYERSWRGEQENLHVSYLAWWANWISPVALLPLNEFKFRYYSSGSIEAIRDSIAHLASDSPGSPIHAFQGEYEGYAEIARTFKVPTVFHDRLNWRNSLALLEPGAVFYLSQPSSIDGEIWPDFSAFMDRLEDINPTARVRVDLAYLGAVPFDYDILLHSPRIDQIYLSLSKAFGVYYHRIGAVFSRTPLPGMEGNRWFKNIFSMELGKRLMARFALGVLPAKYAPSQDAAIRALEVMGLHVQPSAVVLLGHGPKQEGLEAFNRAAGSRYCFTPFMDLRINP